jgi:hypothetical protein
MLKMSSVLCALVFVAFSLAFSQNLLSQVKSADSFVSPLKKKIVDLGASRYYPGGNVRVTLSCYFYPTFLVKEYDEGQKGAEWLAIVPVEKSKATECTQSHAQGEKFIAGPEWRGYFKGVKGNLVFFNDADGTDGGMPFVVYDATTGKKIFEDSAYDSRMWTKKATDSPFNRLRASKAQDGQMSLRYLRVVQADCDLHTEKLSCWEGVRKKLALKSAEMPVCSGYKGIPTRWESAIAYPVEVLLFPQPVVKTIAGPVKCWPVD